MSDEKGKILAKIKKLEGRMNTKSTRIRGESTIVYTQSQKNKSLTSEIDKLKVLLKSLEASEDNVHKVMGDSGMIDWNKLDMNDYVVHLKNTFMFQSTGTAKAVMELVDYYEKREGEVKW